MLSSHDETKHAEARIPLEGERIHEEPDPTGMRRHFNHARQFWRSI